MLYPSIHGMVWVEQDNLGIARLITDHSVRHSVTQVCALAREVIFPGDNSVLQELGRLLGKAGFKAGDFSISHLPDDTQAIRTEVVRLIQQHPTYLCLVCGSQIKAEAALAAINGPGLTGRRRQRIVASRDFRRPFGESPHPYIFPARKPEDGYRRVLHPPGRLDISESDDHTPAFTAPFSPQTGTVTEFSANATAINGKVSGSKVQFENVTSNLPMSFNLGTPTRRGLADYVC